MPERMSEQTLSSHLETVEESGGICFQAPVPSARQEREGGMTIYCVVNFLRVYGIAFNILQSPYIKGNESGNA